MPAMKHERAAHLDRHVQECVADCLDCFEAASECIAYCLGRGREHPCVTQLALFMDCAAICQLSADFLLRGSGMHHLTCAVCGTICERCAIECERIDPSDGHWRRCADACRRCAESCHDLAVHHAPVMERDEGTDEHAN